MLQAERGKKRLAFLLKQAEVFQHFAPAAADQGKKCARLPSAGCYSSFCQMLGLLHPVQVQVAVGVASIVSGI
jgi:hypothetical protein